ncbi:response regulator [Solimonas sp. K1W22B-7]|uniref:response regulator n=1 Tax=Solimonas sp. K1W22B-7 TaxID=2303331 RepID=UPI000E32FCF9|nr:response regulator [Solimonas sp. K1W22B-7]AXQ28455.1 response regulator [Solimonas sp. K1W22B-7]
MTPKPTLLLIDDEERILRSLAMLFRGDYRLHTTTDPHEALAIIGREPVHVIVSDQRMPIMRGAELLRQVREKSPNTMRLLLTGYSELEAVVASVNEGEIFRFINKPWDAAELRDTVRQAADISRSLMAAGPVAPPQPLFTETGSFVAPALVKPSETLLVIDDDAEVVQAVQEIVGPSMAVLWAQTLDQAMTAIEQHEIAVIVSELVVKRETVTPLLKLLKAHHPEVVTVVLTPFQDVSVFIGLINQGQVFRLLPKPVRRGPLGMNIASALRHHRALRDAPKLRVAYQVEKIRQPEEATGSVANRVMGLLSRIRGRTAASPGA